MIASLKSRHIKCGGRRGTTSGYRQNQNIALVCPLWLVCIAGCSVAGGISDSKDLVGRRDLWPEFYW